MSMLNSRPRACLASPVCRDQCEASTACSPPSAVNTPTTIIRYSFRNSRRPCQGLGLWMSMASAFRGECASVTDGKGARGGLVRRHDWAIQQEVEEVAGTGGRRARWPAKLETL